MEYAVGLDIGTTKVVAIAGSRNEYGKFEVLSMGEAVSSGVSRGMVQNITETENAIYKAVSKVEEELSIKVTDVMVGIAGQHIRSMKHMEYINREDTTSLINQEDIDRLEEQVQILSMPPGEAIIHSLAQEYKIDSNGNIQNPIGMSGQRLEAQFHLVIGKIEAIQNISRCVTGVNLKLGGLTLEPIASGKSVLSEEEKEAGVALIDIGGGTSDLTVFKGGGIRHTAVIPVGGNIITKDIEEACGLIKKQAENLKIQLGSAWPGQCSEDEYIELPSARGELGDRKISVKNLAKIINARVVEIIDMVNEQITQYVSENPKRQLNAGVVLTGGGANLKHIKQVVEYVTGMNVRVGVPNEHLDGSNAKHIQDPKYATAVGLLMESVHKTEEDIRVKQKVEEQQQQLELEAEDPITYPEELEPEELVIEKPKTNFLDRLHTSFMKMIDPEYKKD